MQTKLRQDVNNIIILSHYDHLDEILAELRVRTGEPPASQYFADESSCLANQQFAVTGSVRPAFEVAGRDLMRWFSAFWSLG